MDDAPFVQWLSLHQRVLVRTFSVFDPPAEIADGIDEFRPHRVKGYGSFVEALYAHGSLQRRPLHRPRVVTYAGDSISEPVLRFMREELGIAVVSVYRTVEVGIIGWECERQCGHHLNIDLCPIRIVDAERRELPPGEPGEVVASNLVNRGTILLNYVLGDLARRLPGPCRCGRSLPLLSHVEGRTSDWLQSASGQPVHPQALRGILSPLQEVRRYQLVQEHLGRVRVVAVTTPGADHEAIRSRIIGEVERLEDPLDAEVEFSETLPRTEGGKVRTVVSHQVGPVGARRPGTASAER